MVGPALARRLAELVVTGKAPIDDYRVEKYLEFNSNWDPCTVERHNWLTVVKQ